MTQEDKELLLKDLCARLPYKIKCKIKYIINNETTEGKDVEKETDDEIIEIHLRRQEVRTDWVDEFYDISCIKPYLRLLSSMTEEEKEELLNILPKYWSLEIDKLGDLYFDICDAGYPDIELFTDIIDWLNTHHFDYRGLIEKGLALEAPEGMYNV